MTSKEERLRILVLGPQACGKSNISNFLSGLRKTPTESYIETSPLRILEVVVEGLKSVDGRRSGKGGRATVELWDVGGDTRHQNCYEAIKHGADGIIFVANIDEPGTEKKLDLWTKIFMDPTKTPPNHCVVFAHHSRPPSEDSSNASPARCPPLPRTLTTCRGIFETSLDGKSEDMSDLFQKLVEQILHTRKLNEEKAQLEDQLEVRVGASQ
jgi:Rab family protein